jgi:hypothetical protein
MEGGLGESFTIQHGGIREIGYKQNQQLNALYLRENLRAVEEITEANFGIRTLFQESNKIRKQVGIENSISSPLSVVLNTFRSDFEEMSFVGSSLFVNIPVTQLFAYKGLNLAN